MWKTAETYVRIEADPFLARARAYRVAHEAWHTAWGAFAETFGATGFLVTGTSLTFASQRDVPEGWTQLRASNNSRSSRPKKDHPDRDRLAAMRAEWPAPDRRAVYGEAVLTRAEFVDRDDATVRLNIGGFETILEGPWVGWAGDVMLGHVPDAEAFVAKIATERPDLTPTDATREWRMPPGLVRITEAEYKLALAQAVVDAERAAAASPTSPSQEP